ncbi:AAA family ATPase [Prevotella sp. tf2-5]|uniref:AAA family ATPase n=1 Tax=Prevotella sp. tf2-5 TaxID=1761889 RepID=UPI0008EE8837|nr:AAA family ATPase [Prevotella sp. tf2-5]SFP03228.1 Predicted ATP-binding protein involved in virulence [Prevotella sp. tf2-5]
MLKHISIKKLFQLYDYEIDLTASEGNPIQNMMFLTGPNGMGKSTILKSVAHVYKGELGAFSTFPFETMTFDFDSCRLMVSQQVDFEVAEVDSDISAEKTVRISCDFLTKGQKPVSEHGEWAYKDGLKLAIPVCMPNMEMYFNSHKCLYISDHRLQENVDDAVVHPEFIINVLRTIQAKLTEGFAMPPGAVVGWSGSMEERINKVKETMKLLSDCDVVIPIDLDVLENENNVSDHLLIGCERAINNCGTLLLRLQGFQMFMESSKFLGKTFRITMANGLQFYAQNEDKTMLGFSQLSLGEKHIISQIYTMFFSPIPYQLVLVDEPELSFHLMWQMQYLNNIKAVQNMRKCAFLIATHSTQVFEGKFELATDLFTQSQQSE